MRFAEATVNNPTPAILYGDEDERDTHGRRRRPWFKPSWNSEMFLALDFVSTVAAVRIDIARKFLPTPRNLTQLLLEVSSQQGPIIHLPHVLCHTFFRHGNSEERLLEVRRHLRKFGATCRLGPFDTIKVEWPLPDILPLVSIMIPTKDKANLLRACVESVLVRTEYANFEILIIDNGSVEPSTKRYFDEIAENPRVRIISYAGSFNFSAMNNFAAQHSLGDYLCLLNNDTEILERTWLTEMMRYAVRSEVGAVGAKLLYEDGSIQHAGVVVGIGGVAGHAHRHLPSGSPGYFRQPHVSQFVSAVTAACLVVKKSKFTEVGGLDELELPVAFNDVDFCLKLQAAGYRNVYVPHAVLVHHESKSRGSDSSRRNVARFRREVRVLQERWGTGTYADPLHHPHLERGMETYIVRL
ncbi:MAG TPA: glycosyltransferase family 2 protein [Sphingomicrobium sp.]|nr:glycosyltransferase family 2 protein [Sphingomicrobium sp.]